MIVMKKICREVVIDSLYLQDSSFLPLLQYIVLLGISYNEVLIDSLYLQDSSYLPLLQNGGTNPFAFFSLMK